MGKQPYIPIYIGDWEQDTNCLSLEAEGACLKIVFKCWKNQGIFMTNVDSICRLLKIDRIKFAAILLELKTNHIFDIAEREDGAILFTSRRVVRDLDISAKRKVSGSKGGSKTKANNTAKTKQITDNENDNAFEDESDNGFKIGGKGERVPETELADYELWTQSIIDNSDAQWEPMYMNSRLQLPMGRYIGLIEDHLSLLARYPKMRPSNQQAFRYSLIKHLRDNKDKPVQNGTVNGTNKTANHVGGLAADWEERHGNKSGGG